MEVSSKKKEAYYTATQMQLVRTRFFGNRSAMIAGSILLFMIVCSLFSGFLSRPAIVGSYGDRKPENKLHTIINNNIDPAIIAERFPKKRVLTNCICVAV